MNVENDNKMKMINNFISKYNIQMDCLHKFTFIQVSISPYFITEHSICSKCDFKKITKCWALSNKII